MKGTSVSKMMRSAGAPGVIRPLGKPNKVAGFNVIVFMSFAKLTD